MRFVPALAVVALATGFSLGCTVDADSTAPEAIVTSTGGALTIDWTIRGAANADSCLRVDATLIEVTVRDDANQSVGTFQQSCSVFAISIALAPGIYAADARLVGPAGARRSANVRLDFFTIYDRSQLSEPLDFADSAFRF
jgi:hypothetical protein